MICFSRAMRRAPLATWLLIRSNVDSVIAHYITKYHQRRHQRICHNQTGPLPSARDNEHIRALNRRTSPQFRLNPQFLRASLDRACFGSLVRG